MQGHWFGSVLYVIFDLAFYGTLVEIEMSSYRSS
ncbi:hypothetical protein AGR6A_pa30008 [Agrobacterium sp. NCPPB 925]|nr:hypothetical protein AGR6A_pa30008 [Agrobacterium sp. NCPPB 925]